MVINFKNWFVKEEKPLKGLLLIEWATIVYLAFTALLVCVLFNRIAEPLMQLSYRSLILAMVFCLVAIYQKWQLPVIRYIRTIAQFTMLPFWYSNTYDFNSLFSNLDYIMASVEQSVFGCQPALAFSNVFSGAVWSEAFNMGYFFYYPMILVTALYYLFFRTERFERVTFVILSSFFIYYVVFIFVPVAGPQFYYQAVGVDSIAHANFPNIGNYFAYHTDMLPAPGYKNGLFYHLVLEAQNSGERPTAAFPSSHVGISTILMLICLCDKRHKLILVLLPFYILLCCATVYIQAHYLIDVIAGLVTAVMVYFLTSYIYSTLSSPKSFS